MFSLSLKLQTCSACTMWNLLLWEIVRDTGESHCRNSQCRITTDVHGHWWISAEICTHRVLVCFGYCLICTGYSFYTVELKMLSCTVYFVDLCGHHIQKLDQFQMRYLRKIALIKWQVHVPKTPYLKATMSVE